MGKAHESNKEGRKLPVMTAKEKKAVKRAKKQLPERPPFMGHH